MSKKWTLKVLGIDLRLDHILEKETLNFECPFWSLFPKLGYHLQKGHDLECKHPLGL